MSWAVAHTHPREEDRVVWHATMSGYEAWCPKIRYKRRRFQHQKLAFRHEPLFPRYVLIKFQQQWYGMLSLLGLSKLIMSNQRPAILSDKFVHDIKDGCDRDGFYVLKKFIVGQTVRVEKGVLAGQIGIYDGMTSKERAAVLLQMFDTTIRASIREEDLVAA